MDCENATVFPAKVFTFTEYSDGKILKSYSRGNGRFFTEIPSSGLTITFGLTKTADSLDITIYDDSLIQWLRTFPPLRDCLDSSKVSMTFSSHGAFPSIYMDVLLPCYPEISAEFDRYKRERRNFDALELFIHHFLREGSVFATFGFENLHEKQILTDLHFHDIQCEYRSMSKDLDLLDEMISEADEPAEMNKPFIPAVLTSHSALGGFESRVKAIQDIIMSNILSSLPYQLDLTAAIRSEAGIPSHTRDFLLSMGSSQVYLDVVGCLAGSQMDIGSIRKESTLCRATLDGRLNRVRFLLKRAKRIATADVVLLIWCAAEKGHLDVADLLLGYDPEVYQTLLATIIHLTRKSNSHHSIARLTKLGAAVKLMGCVSTWWIGDKCGYCRSEHLSPQPNVAKLGKRSPANILESTNCSHWNLIDLLEKHRAKIIDMETCPTVAAIRARERRTTTIRLLAKIGSSRETLLDAGARKDVSNGLGAFVGQVGTHLSIWKSGTRAIRDISEGYKPSGLPDIVSALQVADAMRLAVPPSQVVCSNKEFVDDIPRWASLLSPEDRTLFWEIVCHLWGLTAESIVQEGEGPFDRKEALRLLQELVDKLVRTSGLFGHDSANSCGTYQLHSLRELTFSLNANHASGERHSLAEWDPFPTPEVHSSLHEDAPKPPDPEVKQSMVLARITILMAGAIFGTILLYLCLSRHGFPTLRQPVLASGAENGSVSDQMITRNCFILAMYIGSSFLPDSVNVEVTEHSLAASPPVDIAQGHMVSYNSNDPQGESLDAGDAVMQDAPRSCSPSLLSYPTASPATTAISPLTMTTGTPGSSIASTSEDGSIRCEYCKSEFKLGKNGRRGQTSNLQKHKKRDHPETIPGYHRVLYKCRWGCGATTPDKSNIKVHERQHCAKRKGKQPRRHGKWREDGAAL